MIALIKMVFGHNVFILIYCMIVLQPETTTSTPLPPDRIKERSLEKPSVGSNYLDNLVNSPSTAARDVQDTIAEVEKILSSDPTLPRLTRGEIEDLFEAVTKEEYEKSVQKGDLSRAKHMRALMLVLPYNANYSSDNDLQDLYNRPPITKLISNERKEEKKQKIVIPSGKVEVHNISKQMPTTYKPSFRIRPLKAIPDPTTYHPYPTTTTLTTSTPRIISETTTLSSAQIKTSTSSGFPQLDALFESNKNRFSSHYSADPNDFRPGFFKPLPTSSQLIDPELEDILKNLGFAAKSQSKKRFKLDDPPPEELTRRMLSSTIKQDSAPQPFAFLPSAPSISAEDFRKALTPNIAPRDFSKFKPIPEATSDIPADLESYLKEFGLYPPFESRLRKDLKESQAVISDRIDLDVIDDLPVAPIPNKTSFKPTDPDEEDYKKLQDLLRTLQELQRLNNTLSEDVLAKLDPRHFNLSQTLLSQGPNPILETEIDLSKNEIKRQTDSPEPIKIDLGLNTDDPTTTSSPAESTNTQNVSQSLIDDIFVVTPEPSATFAPGESGTTTTTTTEEPARNNIAALGDSFAGGLGDADNAEPLPPPRKNGFYFLSDWNSFLEVGEDPDKIIVRFDPKVGDPSRFIPVNVP